MEMTIDEAIEWYNGLECYTPQAKEARVVAIKTMRKYQKIMNIVINGDDTHYKLLMQIKEVIEDGNDTANTGSDIEKLKPCINYEDGCEEWAGCPCVYYKAGSED